MCYFNNGYNESETNDNVKLIYSNINNQNRRSKQIENRLYNYKEEH